MPFNGAGQYAPPGTDFPAVASTLIESAKFNNVINDIATALSTCITKDGQTTVTANLPMNGFRHTGVADGTAATHYASLGQLQSGAPLWGGTTGGAANVQTATLSPGIAAYTAGQSYRVIAGFTNTAACTINFNAAGAKSIFWRGAALIGGEIIAGGIYELLYDGTQFHIISSSLPITQTLSVATTSGTTQTITGIPSWATEIIVGFVLLSGSGTSLMGVRLGTSGGVENTGYDGAAFTSGSTQAPTTLAAISSTSSPAAVYNGYQRFILVNKTTNTWAWTGTVGAQTICYASGGYKSLAGVLDRVQIANVNGTDTLDAGTMYVIYR